MGHLQSTAKRPLSIVPAFNFVSINGQAGNFLQTNEKKDKKSLFFHLENVYFLKTISL